MALSSPRFKRDPNLRLAANNQPSLKVGARGEAVKILQQALIDLGFAMPRSNTGGFPDGIYGSETEATVKAFQRANALSADGIAGRDTLLRLDQIYAAREERERLKEIAEANAPAPFGKWFIT
jgi:peptidoglycan hydrolase-like protein with peptidoglycan-binding domain